MALTFKAVILLISSVGKCTGKAGHSACEKDELKSKEEDI